MFLLWEFHGNFWVESRWASRTFEIKEAKWICCDSYHIVSEFRGLFLVAILDTKITSIKRTHSACVHRVPLNHWQLIFWRRTLNERGQNHQWFSKIKFQNLASDFLWNILHKSSVFGSNKWLFPTQIVPFKLRIYVQQNRNLHVRTRAFISNRYGMHLAPSSMYHFDRLVKVFKVKHRNYLNIRDFLLKQHNHSRFSSVTYSAIHIHTHTHTIAYTFKKTHTSKTLNLSGKL